MWLVSTRDRQHRSRPGDAILHGLAPDGGLYVPESLPTLTPQAFDGAESLPDVAGRLLALFFDGDALEVDIPAICHEAFDFPAPLVTLHGLPGPASVLELFHGPTSAFKDFGARFLASSLARIRRGSSRPLTILVATSGDTGGAVAAAFHRRKAIEVVVLFPQGLVSPRQAQQLACWGANVHSFAVRGNFDDCQRLVKQAFADPDFSRSRDLSSANSINIGRLLPQMVYYARASLEVWRQSGKAPSFIVPAGNMGNVLACVWARACGLPIARIVLATNANLTITDFFQSGEWRPRPSVPTLASAMDVGNPSNMERLLALYPDPGELRQKLAAYSVSDEEIRSTIRRDDRELGQVWCPHTATAAHVYRQVVRHDPGSHWVLVATAHPAKFDEIVEPLIGRAVDIPPALTELLARPSLARELPATLDALRNVVLGGEPA